MYACCCRYLPLSGSWAGTPTATLTSTRSRRSRPWTCSWSSPRCWSSCREWSSSTRSWSQSSSRTYTCSVRRPRKATSTSTICTAALSPTRTATWSFPATCAPAPHSHRNTTLPRLRCAPLRRCNDGHVIVDRLESSYCRVQSTEVDTLVTPDTLSVDSLAVNGSLTAPANTSCDVVEVAGMRQWASAFLQTFDDAAEAASWRGGRAATCDGDGVLGGGCGSGSQEVTRTVTGLPEHSRLQARPARPWRRMWPPRPPLSFVTFPATGHQRLPSPPPPLHSHPARLHSPPSLSPPWLQLEASFLFVDAWRGEHAYAKVGGAPSR